MGKNDFDNFDWLSRIFRDNEKRTIKEKNDGPTIIEDNENLTLDDAQIEEITSWDLPTDFENSFALDPRANGVYTESISDGLILSLCNVGCVDIEYISMITGQDLKTVITTLKGSIYQNPDRWEECFYKGWETAEEYLSGNLVRKYKSASRANDKYKGYFQANLDALQEVMPPSIATEDIYAPLGAPWIPADVIDKFIDHLLGPVIPMLSASAYRTRHSEELALWEIPGKNRYSGTRYSTLCYSTYGTTRLDALTIIEKTLNQKTIAVYDEEKTGETRANGKPKTVRVLNEKETVLALDKQEKILEDFNKWLWSDPVRRVRLEEIYEERYSSNKVRRYDGSFLTFPGLNPKIELFPYQKNAVARILFTPNTLLAHDVGSGKTFVMISAGMELKRMGIAKKNIYVVPNNLVGQWRDTFLYMYKDAKLLIVEPKVFNPQKKWETLAKIRDEEYDGIIMAYSCFENIPMSKNFQIDKLEKEIKVIEKNSQTLYSNSLSPQRRKLENELNTKILTRINPEEVCFDKLGINTIFLDEAHNYKNVPVDTKIDRVLGISFGSGSAKCQDMLDKVMCVQEQNNGRGAVFATGTPITNSLTDAFVMQTYLQGGELKLLGLASFDGWIGMFAERHTDFEVDIDTSKFRLATRFSKFHNLPELTALFASIADFHTVSKKDIDLPDFCGYTDNLIPPDASFVKYLQKISERADLVRHHKVPRNKDNLLLITTDGRKAALDVRLVDDTVINLNSCKVLSCAKNVFDIYNNYPDKTQLVFSDYGTPKETFNVYTELKRLLVSYGIPQGEIEFVHFATTDKKRDLLFDKVRKGKIRVLIGSTLKLGLGVNVQDMLVAIHHLDVPWRPADMVQREGRILRQGNTNDEVFIHRYITKGSFDAYSWQLLETKQRFISSLLAGNVTDRQGSDVYDTALNYAEIKALAIGNPAIKERVEVSNELNKLIILRRELNIHREGLHQELNKLPSRIERQKQNIANALGDSELYKDSKRELTPVERKDLRTELENALIDNSLKTSETELFEYQGFKIVLPSGMSYNKPFIWLLGSGKYYIELGDSPLGYLVRIDNFLEDFENYIKKQEDKLDKLEMVQVSIEQELNEDDEYSERIEALTKRLEQLDKNLGVNKK
ncbi:MAG: DEAD/DEAH box helicase family protein [Clostridia bacterium]|nr:DEAD/DEAH box helicase family protein [Clostridia bacterium]